MKGGPFVGACITYENGLWQACIDGEPCGPAHADPVYARDVYRVWHSGRRIDHAIYQFRLATKQWAREHDPTHPVMTPHRPVQLSQRRSLF